MLLPVKSTGLDKTPLGPVVKELGQQLAAGKLDVEKLQKLMKDIKMDGEEGEKQFYRSLISLIQMLLSSHNTSLQQFGAMFLE